MNWQKSLDCQLHTGLLKTLILMTWSKHEDIIIKHWVSSSSEDGVEKAKASEARARRNGDYKVWYQGLKTRFRKARGGGLFRCSGEHPAEEA
ncbi:hypothetical protein N665_0157s0026 [Sinapis alba]|nr:hypothetical protein N665_0157s0026 [Sinapis alba]